jgi:hypothetical protein
MAMRTRDAISVGGMERPNWLIGPPLSRECRCRAPRKM